jgi:glutathione peroxidase
VNWAACFFRQAVLKKEPTLMSRALKLFLLIFTLILGEIDAMAEESERNAGAAAKALDFKMKSIDGKEVDLNKYQGDVVLVVNVASECGLTPQYEQLQALHKKYGPQGLRVIGFPCNQFGRQEPGSAEEIREFCTSNYGVTFDLFEKVDVNGNDACPLYKLLTGLATKPKGAGDVSWNFEKFLIDRDGKVVRRFEPQTGPNDPVLIGVIEGELKADPPNTSKDKKS